MTRDTRLVSGFPVREIKKLFEERERAERGANRAQQRCMVLKIYDKNCRKNQGTILKTSAMDGAGGPRAHVSVIFFQISN
jgi:hypothetical protein